jgi:hypothetical protein
MKLYHPLKIALADSVDRPAGGVDWQPSPPIDTVTFTPFAISCCARVYEEEASQQLLEITENTPLLTYTSINAIITRLKPAFAIVLAVRDHPPQT